MQRDQKSTKSSCYQHTKLFVSFIEAAFLSINSILLLWIGGIQRRLACTYSEHNIVSVFLFPVISQQSYRLVLLSTRLYQLQNMLGVPNNPKVAICLIMEHIFAGEMFICNGSQNSRLQPEKGVRFNSPNDIVTKSAYVSYIMYPFLFELCQNVVSTKDQKCYALFHVSFKFEVVIHISGILNPFRDISGVSTNLRGSDICVRIMQILLHFLRD